MANYFSDGIADSPFTADEDLTTRQYMLVICASTPGNCASATGGCNPTPIGILTNDPSAGQAAAVKMIGFTKAKARCNACYLDHGAFLIGASDGFLEPLNTVSSEIAIARWFGPRVTSTDASVLGNVLLNMWPSGCAVSAS